MQTGTKISLLGHGTLVTWALLGGTFQSEPLPFVVQEVSVISAEEFARLSAQIAAPEVATEPAVLRAQEDPLVYPPELASEEAPRPQRPRPERVSSAPEPEPAVVHPKPEPEPQVSDVLPTHPERPEPLNDTPQFAALDAGRVSDRVAPEPIAPPEPDSQIADVAQEEVAPEVGAEANQPAQDATQQEVASDRIVTEAESESDNPSVLESTPRPRLRPRNLATRPDPAPETEPPADPPPEPQSAPQDIRAADVNSAVADALANLGVVEAPAPSGPPLTEGERNGLRRQIAGCWNLGTVSTEVMRTVVVVGLSLQENGMPETSSIRLLSFEGSSQAAANTAFAAARRAIIRCSRSGGRVGYDLPVGKYQHWKEVEITFNPANMRLR